MGFESAHTPLLNISAHEVPMNCSSMPQAAPNAATLLQALREPQQPRRSFLPLTHEHAGVVQALPQPRRECRGRGYLN